VISRRFPTEGSPPTDYDPTDDDLWPRPRRRLSLWAMLGMLALGLAALALVAVLVLVFAVAMALQPF